MDQLVDRRLVADVADLYHLTVEAMCGLDRVGKVLAEKILREVETSKTRPLSRLLHGLGIRHVGEHVAGLLSSRFHSIERLMEASEADLTAVHEIGPEIAHSVATYFLHPQNRELVARLAAAGVCMADEATVVRPTLTPLAGQTYVFTGTLRNLVRDEAAALVKKLGGRTSSTVSSKTTCVVAGEQAGSKLERARALGIPVWTEEEFEAHIAQWG